MSRTAQVLLVCVLFTGALTACGAAAVTQYPAAAPARRATNAVLQPGDLVRLKIWREPDLSGDYRVDETGVAVFPKVGSVPVGELSSDSVKSILLARYAAYLRDPAVEVTFLRRVNVLGEVKNPGLYHADPTMTVADVIALAGGVNPDGNPNGVELVRDGRRLPVELTRASLLSDSPIRSGDELLIARRSWLSRNTATVLGAGVTAVAIIVAAVVRP